MITTFSKKELIQKALEKRTSKAYLDDNINKSAKIISKILNSDDFKNAKNVAIYLPIRGEIDISSLVKVKDKNFFLPRCNGLELEFALYSGELVKNKWNILEPVGKKINPEILDVIYIPAILANKNNYRLGYGKGFYDRFFKTHKTKAKKVLILAKDFIADEFVQDDFDIQNDYFITN